MILKYVIKQEDKNKTINKVLGEKFELSNRLFSKLIRNKRITVNNINIDTRQKAKIGDRDLNLTRYEIAITKSIK